MVQKHDDSFDENDIVIEEDFSEDSGVDKKYQSKIEKLSIKIKDCESLKEEYLLGWQRAQADFINYKKNNNSVFSDAKNVSLIEFVESILPILDSFEMALAGQFDESFKKWLTGFEYVKQQFTKVLAEHGVEEINSTDQLFNPQLHEAIEEIETSEKDKDGKIAQVVLKGYKTSKRIIRAPQVKVYKYTK